MSIHEEPFVLLDAPDVEVHQPHTQTTHNPHPTSNRTSHLHLKKFESQSEFLSAGFSTRTGGYSQIPFDSCNLSLRIGDHAPDVIANRHRLSRQVGFDIRDWTCAEQVHGTHVTRVLANHRGSGNLSIANEIASSDALITDIPGIMLVSYYADCVPLYFFDPIHHVVGLAHAGWKGTYGEIAARVIEELTSHYGTVASQLYCAIGPSIGPCCYQVGQDLMNQFATKFISITNNFVTDKEPYKLNLKQINKAILLKSGVSEQHILVSTYCTHCRDDLFFSHRRDHGATGRMTSWIGLKNS